MSVIKNYPRIPQNIINSCHGNSCVAIDDNGRFDEKKRCQCCGVASLQTLKGSLADLRGSTGHRIVYFERVSCPYIDDILPLPERNDIDEFSYIKNGNHTYRYITKNIDSTDDSCPDQCCTRRANENNFGEVCRKQNLEHIVEAYKAIDESNENFFRCYQFKQKSIIGSLCYHLSLCPETGFIKLIIPIYSSPERKSIMGMLLFGHFIIEDEIDTLHGPWLHEEYPKYSDEERESILEKLKSDKQHGNRFFQSINDVLLKYSVIFVDFIERMHVNVRLSIRDYLYALQVHLYDKYSDNIGECGNPDENPGENKLQERLFEIFIELRQHFAVNRLLLFLPDLINGKHPTEKRYHAVEFVENGANCITLNKQTDVIINAEKLPSFNKQKILINDLVESCCITGITFHEYVQDYLSFYGSNDANFFFGFLLEWDTTYFSVQSEKEPFIITHDGFFASLVMLCRTKIASRFAWLKQLNMEYFTSSAVHDIAQKTYMMGLHNISFNYNIKKPSIEKIFGRIDWSQGTNDSKSMFFKRCHTYNKQMFNCEKSISYIQGVLERGDLLEVPYPVPFDPYLRFLANFNQHFNSSDFMFKNNKKLVILHPENLYGTFYGDMNADPEMIERAVSNMVENAFKFAHDWTNIYLDYRIENKKHVFRVTNFGNGIPEDIENRLFGYRQRGDAGKPGHGLGLWGARRYARMHGGDLVIEDGVIGKESKVNPKWLYSAYMYLLCLQNGVYYDDSESDDFYKIRSILYREIEKIQHYNTDHLQTINPIAIYKDWLTIYDEVFVGNIDKIGKIEHEDALSIDSLRYAYDQPTYSITFKLIIPDICKEDSER
jgi:hypothetical protein